MKLRPFAATALSFLGVVVVSPSSAQDPRPSDPRPAESQPPTDRPASPPAAQEPPVASDVPQTAPMPGGTLEVSADAASTATGIDGFESFVSPPHDRVTPPIGERLSPLLFTAGFGYGYAAIKHPDLESRSLSGSFVELTAGTELNQRFRLSFAVTSFQTTIHRTRSGDWREGDFPIQAAAGLRAQTDPVEASESSSGGGVNVQKTLHVHSLAPRLDFLPLGSQGPYIGATAGLAVIQDIGLRAGGNVSLRVGGEWRPFHVFGLGIEAGAHGQLYSDARAAIPYATARLQFYLDPEQFSGNRRLPTVTTFVPSGQRTLPMPTR